MKPSIKILFLLLISYLSTTFAYSQTRDWTFSNASPNVGWDSLSKLIGYPEIMRRMGSQGFADIRFRIDSNGRAQDIQMVAPDFINKHVLTTIQNVKWELSASDTGYNSYWVHFEIQFNLTNRPNSDRLKTLIINAPYPKIKVEY